jgi:hypothetical protein
VEVQTPTTTSSIEHGAAVNVNIHSSFGDSMTINPGGKNYLRDN